MARKFKEAKAAQAKVDEILGLAPGTSYCLIGNPGTGKSTLLNLLTGGTHFASGVSLDGKGFTKTLQEHVKDGISFYDTPGLADSALRKQCAKEITAVLRKGGKFKIFFVITLQMGRVLPQDRDTIELVLDAAPIGEYGIIINQLGPVVYDALVNNKTNPDSDDASGHGCKDCVIMEMMAGMEQKQTMNFHFIQKAPGLEEKNQHEGVAPPDMKSGLVQFMTSVAACSIDATKVKDIPENINKAKIEELQEIIRKAAEDKKFFEECMEEEKKNFKKMAEEQKEREKELKEAMKEANDSAAQARKDGDAKIADLKREMEDAQKAGDTAAEKRHKDEMDKMKDDMRDLERSGQKSGGGDGLMDIISVGIKAVGKMFGLPF